MRLRGVLQIKEILETGRLARVEASLADPRIRALYVQRHVACIDTPPVYMSYASTHYYLE